MSDNKKYYYLKLKDNFFDREEIKVIKGLNKGDTYVCIMLEMYLRSLKRDGKLMMTDRIPFNPQSLSSVLNRSIDEITYAIDVFKEFGLLEVLDNGAIFISDIQNFIGHGSSEAERKAIYRNRIKSENGTLLGQCPDKRPPEIEIEIEKEINIKPQFKSSHFNDDDTKSIITYRKSIKATLKTQQGYTGLENKIKTVMDKYNIGLNKVLEIMASKEWKSIEVDYIKNIKPIQAKKKAVLI